MPVAEILTANGKKKYHQHESHLLQRITEIQNSFHADLPCHIIITKCDLIPGFKEFFSESTPEEINQAWGINLHAAKKKGHVSEILIEQFNFLIKKINQQLLWRLHHERNPMVRPHIKDFPLQLEKIKDYISDFCQKLFKSSTSINLQYIFLTSALQNENLNISANNEEISENTSLQIFTAPPPSSQPYFLKQLFNQQLAMIEARTQSIGQVFWQQRWLYAASFATVLFGTFLLGKDFEKGIKQTYALQNNLQNYKLTIQKIHNPDQALIETINLLNILEKSANKTKHKYDLAALFNFYSNQSKQKAGVIYRESLHTVLLAQIRNYLGEYLQIPVNKSTETLYTVLQAYLMLNDVNYFQPEIIQATLKNILPSSLLAFENDLLRHADLALHTAWSPVSVDTDLVAKTRKYLNAQPKSELAFIILQNINSNNDKSNLNLNAKNVNPIFTSLHISSRIPNMFTAKMFNNIIDQEINTAATEAALGNWILGNEINSEKNSDQIPSINEQLRQIYLNKYANTWENLITNIDLVTAKSLTQADRIIQDIIGNESSLLQLL